MTSEMKKVVLPVDTENGEFLLWSKEEDKVIEAGKLADLEYKIANMADRMDLSGINDYFEVIPFSPLAGIDIELKNKCEVKMDDNTYNTEEESFVIYDDDRGNSRPIYETEYEDDALEELARLIKESGREDKYNLVRKAEFTCTYDVDLEKTSEISIPTQHIMVEVDAPKFVPIMPTPAHLMTIEEIDKELLKMYTRINELREAKEKSQMDVAHLALCPASEITD